MGYRINRDILREMVIDSLRAYLGEARYIQPNEYNNPEDDILAIVRQKLSNIGVQILKEKNTENGILIMVDSSRPLSDLKIVLERFDVTIKQNGENYLIYIRKENLKPISKGEKIRVFHQTDIDTAIRIAKEGISGQKKVSRNYSYENYMNPAGLFVTTDFNVLKDNNFGYAYSDVVAIEFTANEEDLDTPVWNNQDSFFGQNTNPEPFNHRWERQQQKVHYKMSARLNSPHIANSNNPAMAEKVFDNSEHQALFYGDLNPNQIKRFWVRKYVNGRLMPYIPMTRKEFLSEYSGKASSFKSWKLYKPNEDWRGSEDFRDRYIQKSPRKGNNGQQAYELAQTLESIGYGNDVPAQTVMRTIDTMEKFLFPKQLIQAIGIDKYRAFVDKFYPENR